jgi:protein-disulfide isomerase
MLYYLYYLGGTFSVSKQFWAIVAVIVVLLGGVYFATSNKKDTTTSSNAAASEHVEGSTSTGVKLVEYGDYECPYCGQFYSIVKQVAATNADKIQFQFRNLPLSQIHRNAFAGARAAEAASLQGKFWEMHDALYENQDPNGAQGWVADSKDVLNDYFVGYAKTIGLDTTKFKTDFASSGVNNTINADVAAFKKTGLDESTPTFFLDGKQIQPGYNVADFQKAIDAEIKAKAAAK